MKAKHLILFLIFLCFMPYSKAQEFTKAYGNAQSNKGYHCFYSESHNAYFLLGAENEETITLTKIDPNGNIIWSKKYNGSYYTFLVHEIFVPGKATTDILISPCDYPTYRDLYLVRINGDNGNVVWNKKLTYPTEYRFPNVTITNDNHIIACMSIRAGGIFITKTNIDGDILWAKVLSAPGISFFQQSGNTITDNNGGILFGFMGGIGGTSGIMGLTSDGELNFAYQTNENIFIRNIYKHPENGYILSNYLDYNNRAINNEIIYLDNNYNIVWKKLLNPVSPQNGYCEDCAAPASIVNKKGEIIHVRESAISGQIRYSFSKFDANGSHIYSAYGTDNDLRFSSSGKGGNSRIFSTGTTTRQNICMENDDNMLLSVYSDDLDICDTRSFTPQVTNSTTTLSPRNLSTFTLRDAQYTLPNVSFTATDNLLKARNLCSTQEEKVNLGPDISTCTSQAITLNAGTGYKTYQWSNGTSSPTLQVRTSGTYWVRTVDDCDRESRDTIRVTFSSPTSRSQNIRICQGGSYRIGNKTYTAAGTYTDTLIATTGCDSIVRTILAVDPRYNLQQSFTICQGDSVRIGNKIYKTAGTYRDTLKSVRGCDSIIIANITVNTCGATIGGIVNKYSAVTNFSCNKITVKDGHLFSVGNRVLVIQMQGAVVDTTKTLKFGDITDYRNAGNYEFNTVKAINGNNIELTYSLKNPYDIDGNVQLVYVPAYSDVTISGTLTGQPWNGETGGIIAIEASGTVELNAPIDASGIGFRGGKIRTNYGRDPYCQPDVIAASYSTNDGGQKGEGIAKWDSTRILNKGAWTNGGGGGNNHNAGGAGGALYSKGGNGGRIYFEPAFSQPCIGGGGIGGNSLLYTASKIHPGGGGGSGHNNDNTSSNGGNGGGIIIINTQNLTLNSFNITSNGISAQAAGNDGGSGGGSGGSILISSRTINGTGNINARGGNGANNNYSNSNRQCVAPGGGGSGGFISISNGISTNISTTGGGSGIITTTNISCPGSKFDAEDGQNGFSNSNLVLQFSNNLPSQIEIDTLIIDTLICNNSEYLLPDGTVVSQSGVYEVLFKNTEGCDSLLIVTTLEYQPALSLNLGNDTTLCHGEPLTIGTNISADNYLWNTGSTEKFIEAEAPGIFSLTISNNCSSVTDSIEISAIDCDCNVFIPNAFSPNGDGKNDVLIIKEENIIASRIIIYNKWGEEVFMSENNQTNWNGAHKNKQLPPDVYGYYYTGTCLKGNQIEYKGNITIVR